MTDFIRNFPRTELRRVPLLDQTGLQLLPDDPSAALRDAALVAAVVTLVCLALDGAVFRDALPADYVKTATSALWPRTLVACLQSAWEELIYRFLLTTALIALVMSRRRSDDHSVPWSAIFAAEAVLVWPNLLAFPAWTMFRFWMVGSAWGWLYWKRGFLTALLGHATIHLLLDPLLFMVL